MDTVLALAVVLLAALYVLRRARRVFAPATSDGSPCAGCARGCAPADAFRDAPRLP